MGRRLLCNLAFWCEPQTSFKDHFRVTIFIAMDIFLSFFYYYTQTFFLIYLFIYMQMTTKLWSYLRHQLLSATYREIDSWRSCQ